MHPPTTLGVVSKAESSIIRLSVYFEQPTFVEGEFGCVVVAKCGLEVCRVKVDVNV